MIIEGLRDAHIPRAAELYDEAFGRKFSPAIPDDRKRLQVLRESMNARFGFGAVDGDRLVGLAGFHTPEGSLTSGMTMRGLFHRLGWLNGLRAVVVFGLYERNPEPGELLMDGIAVDSGYRGRGIGGALLDRIIAFAGEHEYATVRLDVIDTNPGARRLYERKGFRAIREQHFPYLRRFLGFGGATTMERR